MICLPSVLSATNLVTCDGKDKWFFNPMKNKCDAVHCLGSVVFTFMFIFMIMMLTQQNNSYDLS